MIKTLKLYSLIGACLLFSSLKVHAQDWMSNLKVAQKLAAVQNKMVLMVWEEETFYDYPVVVVTSNNQSIIVGNLFSEPELNKAIWEHFVPVVVSEYVYDDLYESIKNKRSDIYLDKLSDASLKVMDINGNIVNVNMGYENDFNLSRIIEDYAFNTEFLAHELKNYAESKTFYTSYFLASKYLDFSLYSKPRVQSNLINLAKIYMNDATQLLAAEPDDKQPELSQRLELLELEADLIEGKAGRVLRKLKKMDKGLVNESIKAYQAFLYFTAHKMRNDHEKAEVWRPLVSLVNIKKVHNIVKNNL
ncbi:hypothetical protein [Paucihalobacter sp.]|uniref:hypothetical protein n=1 Tax=Paucihalobacter sp. TaxID=2850405 RepID=UPI002FE0FAA4